MNKTETIRRITKEASVTPLMMKIFFSFFFIITIGDDPQGATLEKMATLWHAEKQIRVKVIYFYHYQIKEL